MLEYRCYSRDNKLLARSPSPKAAFDILADSKDDGLFKVVVVRTDDVIENRCQEILRDRESKDKESKADYSGISSELRSLAHYLEKEDAGEYWVRLPRFLCLAHAMADDLRRACHSDSDGVTVITEISGTLSEELLTLAEGIDEDNDLDHSLVIPKLLAVAYEMARRAHGDCKCTIK